MSGCVDPPLCHIWLTGMPAVRQLRFCMEAGRFPTVATAGLTKRCRWTIDLKAGWGTCGDDRLTVVSVWAVCGRRGWLLGSLIRTSHCRGPPHRNTAASHPWLLVRCDHILLLTWRPALACGYRWLSTVLLNTGYNLDLCCSASFILNHCFFPATVRNQTQRGRRWSRYQCPRSFTFT